MHKYASRRYGSYMHKARHQRVNSVLKGVVRSTSYGLESR